MRTGSEGYGRSMRGAARIGRAGGRSGSGKGSRASGRALPRKPAPRSPRLGALADELRDVAERAGIRVRQERLLREVGYHTQSGLVRLDGEEILLLDHELSPEAKIDLLTGVLRGRDLSGIELSDEARSSLAVPEIHEREPGDAGPSPLPTEVTGPDQGSEPRSAS
jgi:hypothetical protein